MELLIILLLTALNGFFSLSEIALVSTKKARLEQFAAKGNRRARLAMQLLERPEHFLSAVQVGITLIGVVSGAFGGVALADDVRPFLEQVAWLRPYAPQISLVLVVGLITYLTIVLGELVPKTIALNNPMRVSLAVAPVVSLFTRFTYPIVWLLSASTKIVQKILFIKEKREQPVSDEELKLMLKIARQQGVMDQQEMELHQNLFRFADRKASQFMTHRGELMWIDAQESPEAIAATIREHPFSKYLVCDGDLDNPIGYIPAKTFMESYSQPGFDLRKALNRVVLVTPNLPAIKILELLKKHREYFAVVIDEFGAVLGIITLYDITKSILGDLPSQEPDYFPSVTERGDGSFLVDGMMPIDEFADRFECETAHLHREDFATISGLLLDRFGGIPKPGESVVLDHFSIEILDMDGARIDKILVKRVQAG